tara:strand:- start:767 stop:892 length:126 start_codon:yes stop_codon:yes gene_type:complete
MDWPEQKSAESLSPIKQRIPNKQLTQFVVLKRIILAVEEMD